ncbi:MAG: hypothetical protein Kow00127_20680 [Bacteroidales bacterium]
MRWITGLLILVISLSIGKVNAQSIYGEDSVTCVMNNSLYYEFYRQWKQSNYKNEAWKDAVAPWRWVFLNCPASTKNIYLHGERLLDELIKKAENAEIRDKYVDTLMMMYDNRIKYFGLEGYVLGKKGSDLYKLRPDDYKEVYDILKRSIELEGNDANGSTLIYYFRAAEKMVRNGEADTSLLFDIYDQTSEIIEYNINKAQGSGKEQEVAKWENIRGNIELSIEPYATCPQIISIYTLKFNDRKDDFELLKKITKLLDKKDCTDSDLFFEATNQLHKLEPTARTAELMGKMNIKRENFREAATFLEQAVELYEDNNDKADARFFLANVYFQLKNYSKARAECYEILKVRPNDGKVYILIGDMYAASANECGSDELEKKAPYWAAVDMYAKAKSVDPDVDELARNKINTFSQYFPQRELLFFHDLKPGDTYTVGCWINVTTTIRSSD